MWMHGSFVPPVPMTVMCYTQEPAPQCPDPPDSTVETLISRVCREMSPPYMNCLLVMVDSLAARAMSGAMNKVNQIHCVKA